MSLKVLITSGPTSVAIDEMRVISNRSTGEMGRRLAAASVAKGARVTLLEGAVTTTFPLPEKVRRRGFFFYSELRDALQDELDGRPDIVIHAAAVSDFKPQKTFKGKLPSGDKQVMVLVPTPKLVNGIKKCSPGSLLVGFKFEPSLQRGALLRKTRGLFDDARCDLVVANSLKGGAYKAFILTPEGKSTPALTSKQALVRKLIQTIFSQVTSL